MCVSFVYNENADKCGCGTCIFWCVHVLKGVYDYACLGACMVVMCVPSYVHMLCLGMIVYAIMCDYGCAGP